MTRSHGSQFQLDSRGLCDTPRRDYGYTSIKIIFLLGPIEQVRLYYNNCEFIGEDANKTCWKPIIESVTGWQQCSSSIVNAKSCTFAHRIVHGRDGKRLHHHLRAHLSHSR